MSLAQRIIDLTTRIATEFKTVKSKISGNNSGDLSSLLTTAKGSILGAVNEVHGMFANYTPISHVGSGGTAHAVATQSTAGFMSGGDKAKLDAIASGMSFKGVYVDLAGVAAANPTATAGSYAILTRTGQASQFAIWDSDATTPAWVEAGGTITGGATNLSVSRDGTSVTVLSDTGSDATIPIASTTDAGVMSAADKTKLDGVATSATNTPLASTAPAALAATADVGNGTTAARSNHVHPLPTAAQVGAPSTTEVGNTETDFVSTFNTGLL